MEGWRELGGRGRGEGMGRSGGGKDIHGSKCFIELSEGSNEH